MRFRRYPQARVRSRPQDTAPDVLTSSRTRASPRGRDGGLAAGRRCVSRRQVDDDLARAIGGEVDNRDRSRRPTPALASFRSSSRRSASRARFRRCGTRGAAGERGDGAAPRQRAQPSVVAPSPCAAPRGAAVSRAAARRGADAVEAGALPDRREVGRRVEQQLGDQRLGGRRRRIAEQHVARALALRRGGRPSRARPARRAPDRPAADRCRSLRRSRRPSRPRRPVVARRDELAEDDQREVEVATRARRASAPGACRPAARRRR